MKSLSTSITADTAIRIVLHFAEVVQLDPQEINQLKSLTTLPWVCDLSDHHKDFTKLLLNPVLPAKVSTLNVFPTRQGPPLAPP